MSIVSYTLANNQGDVVHIANYGARLLKWITDVDDHPRNIILGYEKLEDYLQDSYFIGAIVGPYANRIAHSICKVDGKTLQLNANEGEHHLHGGNNALANLFWECIEQTKNTLTLRCELADGFNGYPGGMIVEVTYQLLEKSELTIAIQVITEQATIAGPTAHPYFNLDQEQSINQHCLQIFSRQITPTNLSGLPQGNISNVASTEFDYLTPKRITEKTILDNNYLLTSEDSSLQSQTLQHAILQSADKKLKLHVDSNYPAMQVYTGQYLEAPFNRSQGLCLEPQFCPDSPNQSNYPFHLTTQHQPLNTHITYRLEKNDYKQS